MANQSSSPQQGPAPPRQAPSAKRFHRAWLLAFVLCILVTPGSALVAPSHLRTFPLPSDVRSTHYRVRINGHPADVLHAASNYYLVNFDTDGPVTISVTAEDPHFWDRGAEVQPMRLGIRPVRHGATLTFPIAGPGKLTLSRPDDHFADADMLFLFANPPEPRPQLDGVRYFGPGLHRENIEAHTGDRIYLDGGAVLLGAVNLWQVKDVRISGRGTVIYDGPQDPHSDQGWMHKPNWHCIVMDEAQNIEIDGITCITRSRSWQVQMRNSRHIGFYNVKVIGGNPNDANQDGMDWLGGGDTTVSDSFFRASDDVFALQGNWDGYDPALLTRPGPPVTNISIAGSVVSTSISNIMRVNWPQKTFDSGHVHMDNMDVLHTGFGGCKVPFALFELWADPDGHGRHEDYSFSNIRLEDWYSLFQLRQPAPEIRSISFTGIWPMDGPGMVPPVVRGDVQGVHLDDAAVQGFASAETKVEAGAQAPIIRGSSLDGGFRYTPGLLAVGQAITFTASAPDDPGLSFEWLFGDGSHHSGRSVEHRFLDADGTLLDGSGRYRVLLHTRSKQGGETWTSRSIVLAAPGSRVFQTSQKQPPPTSRMHGDDLSFVVPDDGGYTFTLLTSTAGSLTVDDGPPAKTPVPRAQVCGAPGNAVQPVRISTALRKGVHHVFVARDSSLENAQSPVPGSTRPLVLWEGPEVPRQVLPAADPPPLF